MDVLSLCHLPVGVVRWHSPAPSLTVIVKATFTLERDGYAGLAAEQQPLSLDTPGGQTGPNELFAATDFVPFKPRADVLLAGHAHAPAPAWTIRARLGVNEFDKQFFAFAGNPATSIPLVEAYLRSGPSPDSGFVRVGARAPWSPERAVFAGARLISPSGVPVAPLPQGFDYRIFNAAPLDQQIDAPLATAFVVLEGLLPGAPGRRVQLPGVCPRVFLLSCLRDPWTSPPAEAPLRADTLWIDTDRAQCTLTFRGVVPLAEQPPALVVLLERVGTVQSWPSICEQLGRAARIRAVEASDLAHPAPASGWPTQSAPPQPALEPRSHRGSRGTDGPPASAGKPLPPALIEEEPEWATGTAGLKPDQRFAPAVPFNEATSTGSAPREPRLSRGPYDLPEDTQVTPAREESTAVLVPALPFRPASPLPPVADALAAEDGSPGAVAAAPDADAEPETERREQLIHRNHPAPISDVEPEPDWAVGTAALKAEQVFADAIPFRDAAGSMQAIPPAPPLPFEPGESELPRSESLPQLAEPPLLPAEQYAAITAAIWMDPTARDGVLEQHGLTEIEWEIAEQRQMEALEREVGEGKVEKVLALVMALERALPG